VAPRLHREIMQSLLARIAAGMYPAGSMLPKEQQLAAELDVSRGVIRECIRALEERGVVRVRHGRGATVLPARAWDLLDPDVFAAVRSAPGGRRIVGEAAEARALVLGEAAALAASRARPDGLRALEAAVDAVETATDDAGAAAAENEFERALLDAAGNRLLARVAMDLAEATAGVAARGGGGHRRALDAIAAGDAAAARAAVAQPRSQATPANGGH
jgi:DNA-binding FadR family transcriptional regulator